MAFVSVEIPPDRISDVETLIDYIGWGVHEVDSDMVFAAISVWDKCGVAPDYAVNTVYYGMEFLVTEDTPYILDAIRSYLSVS